MSKYLIPIIAIGCITVLEAIALFKGIDGTILSLSFASIGGIIGYCFKSARR